MVTFLRAGCCPADFCSAMILSPPLTVNRCWIARALSECKSFGTSRRSCAREGLALERAFVDGHAKRRGSHRKRDGREPHRAVGTGEIEHGAAGPGAGE